MPRGIYKRKPIVKKGDKFNRLTAVRFDHISNKRQFWLFKCDCGKEKIINASNARRGLTKSCGCLLEEHLSKGISNFKNGMSGTKIYGTWYNMKARCLNKNDPSYKNYGGRGITVCKEWMKFENFYRNMGDKPKKLSLDRINNNGNYCKKNCKWSTLSEQQNNTRRNHLLIFQGKTQTMAQWAKELNIDYNTLFNRLKKGWSIEKILNSKYSVYHNR